MNLVDSESFNVSRGWFAVTYGFHKAVAICRQSKVVLDLNGIRRRTLDIAEVKCVDPEKYRWIGSVMLILFLLCVCCSCFYCQQCSNASKRRRIHEAVLRLQAEFVLQQQRQAVVPMPCVDNMAAANSYQDHQQGAFQRVEPCVQRVETGCPQYQPQKVETADVRQLPPSYS